MTPSVIACLDSWAVLEWLDGLEPATTRVDAVLTGAVMSWVNLAEVHYKLHRRSSLIEAEAFCADLRRIVRLDPAGASRSLSAARLKAHNRMSLADCFAVATAVAFDAPLLTGDPEIIGRPGLGCRVVDLRG